MTDFRQALTGWILIAGIIMLLGIGLFINAQFSGPNELAPPTVEWWRQYANEVEQGTRTPSAMTTRLMIETAVAQNEYATAAGQLLRLVGGGIGFLGLLLTVDLVRYRARHTSPPKPKGD